MTSKQSLPGRKRKRDTGDSSPRPPLAKLLIHQQGHAPQPKPKLGQTFLTLSNKPVHVTCTKCGMQYTKLSSEDSSLHAQYCRSHTGPILWPFPPSRCAAFSRPFTASLKTSGTSLHGSIAVIHYASADKAVQSKLDEVSLRVDQVLCAASLAKEDMQASTFYIFIRSAGGLSAVKKQELAGCAIVRPVQKAHRVIARDPSSSNLRSAPKAEALLRFGEDESAIFCSPAVVPAAIGVDRIWTSNAIRSSGVAIAILDTVAEQAIYATPITNAKRRDLVAFSQPTQAGAKLFERWTGTSAFLVFTDS